MIDDGQAIHYSAVERGTPIYSTDEVEVGKVDEVLDNYRERIFDGIVMEDRNGDLRFVDAPEVARTAERGVTLSLTRRRGGASCRRPRRARRCFTPTRGPAGSRGCSAAAGERS